MNTQLIYVSKEKAEVQDEETGVFFNQVSQGVKVKKGDQVSVEGIAINSIGVGSDIIEVPKKILNYDYYPNEFQLNCYCYIHNNFKYTCKMPFTSCAIDTTSTTNAYGYLTNAGIPALKDFTTGTSSKPFPNIMPGPTTVGQRFYIGRYAAPAEVWDQNAYTVDRQNPPIYEVPGNTIGVNVPGGNDGDSGGANPVSLARVWCPLKTDIEVNISTGYDNPDNIANKITADMHSCDAVPEYFQEGINKTSNRSYYVDVPAARPATAVVGNSYFNQLTCSSQNSSTILIRGNPSNTNPFQLPAEAALTNGYYNSWIGVSNPFMVEYGSRLTSQLCLKNNTFCNARAAIPNPVTQSNIVNLLAENQYAAGPPRQDGWDIGSVMATNLAYNETNLKVLRDFIHNTKVWYGLGVANAKYNTEFLNTPQGKRAFQTYYDISRDDDTTPQNANPKRRPIQSNFRLAADVSPAPQSFQQPTFYRDEFYKLAHLPDEANNFEGFEIDETQLIFEGQLLNPKSIAQKLDINICCVNTGTTGNNEKVIGIIRESGIIAGPVVNPPTTATGGSRELSYNNYVLVNLNYNNPRCDYVMLVNPFTSKSPSSPPVDADFDGLLNVGAPNINMLFDATRGRFAFSNMSWAHYTESTLNAGGTAIETAGGEQVITANFYNENFGAQGSAGDNIRKSQGFIYAQSGIGIVDVSVKNLTTGEYEKIDYEVPVDVEKKFNNSLFARLGFEYYKFVNKNGIPYAIYTERYHNNPIPQDNPTLFPYPLTNNAQFDTALSISFDNGIGSVNAPQFSLQTERGQPNISITAESANTYATNLPQKLEYPYWLIQSDIIEGIRFNSENNGSEDNIMALCNRAYLAGDFAFSFAPDYKFTATKDYVITGIKTRILNPDLTPAEVNDKTSVIYKIESPLPMFTNQVEPQDLKREEKQKELDPKEQHSRDKVD